VKKTENRLPGIQKNQRAERSAINCKGKEETGPWPNEVSMGTEGM